LKRRNCPVDHVRVVPTDAARFLPQFTGAAQIAALKVISSQIADCGGDLMPILQLPIDCKTAFIGVDGLLELAEVTVGDANAAEQVRLDRTVARPGGRFEALFITGESLGRAVHASIRNAYTAERDSRVTIRSQTFGDGESRLELAEGVGMFAAIQCGLRRFPAGFEQVRSNGGRVVCKKAGDGVFVGGVNQPGGQVFLRSQAYAEQQYPDCFHSRVRALRSNVPRPSADGPASANIVCERAWLGRAKVSK